MSWTNEINSEKEVKLKELVLDEPSKKHMNKLYAFWKYDIPPFLLGGEVLEVQEDGFVTIMGYTGRKFKPVLIVPLEKGIKLQKRLKKAEAKYKKTVAMAKNELLAVVKEISK